MWTKCDVFSLSLFRPSPFVQNIDRYAFFLNNVGTPLGDRGSERSGEMENRE